MSGNLFSSSTQSIVYNFKQNPVQRMLDFDFLCRREKPSIASLITPGTEAGKQKVFFGHQEILLPVYGDIPSACKAYSNADVFVNFASFRSAYESSVQALQQESIRTVVIIAEGVPEKDVRHLIQLAKKLNKFVIGPATVGGIQAGSFRIGDTAGTIDNIVACKLYRPGSVGFVSKSGGLSNEMYNILSRCTDGLYEGIAIGGDVFPGSTFIDHIRRYEQICEIKMIVILGELGGTAEYEIVEALKDGSVTKPICAWVTGTCAKMFPTEVQFGHAGAKSGGDLESADAKNSALKAAGAHVPQAFEDFPSVITKVYQNLVTAGTIVVKPEPTIPEMPVDASAGRVRRATGIVSTICDDRGEVPTYSGVPITDLIADKRGIGDVIALLWFKRELPPYFTKYIEMVIMLCADHGPAVSGAHNTIVTARAGKDVVSCLASGLLTIGPRFGGAIDDAARCFKDACDRGLTPRDFVESMKKQGRRVPGIGHRIKSADNLDQRVVMMKEFASQNFPSRRYITYALSVEQYTLTKAANLLLNVDGCIAALFLDLMEGCASFSPEEISEVVEIGYLNGLFVLARSIGLIGHALDQKRLKQPLYRHPWDDVLYST
jgi:ATP citrate (pro-S)-lyase